MRTTSQCCRLSWKTGEIEAFRREVGDQVVSQVAAMEAAAQERIGAIAANATTRMAALENVNSVYESWRPRIEGYMNRFKLPSIQFVPTSIA
jgi:hypothetical protein